MPRKAREKYPEAIYHIMCRSESEFLLFRDDEDNDYYLGLLKRFVDKFKSSIYAYCIIRKQKNRPFDSLLTSSIFYYIIK